VEESNELLNVIDTATNTVIIHEVTAIFYDHLTITPDGTRLYVTSPFFTKVVVLDTSTNTVVDNVPIGFSPIFPAITSDGTRVYTVNVENTVSVINTATNTLVATIPGFDCPLRIAITPVPKNKDECKDGGYKNFRALAFPNQGQCVKYVNGHSN
jgi:YVTN family beta-propeller protein